MRKTMAICLLVILFLTGCRRNLNGLNDLNDQIIFSTNKSSYIESDSIIVSLKNDSDSAILIGLR
jgi:uncharacterized protein YcfL